MLLWLLQCRRRHPWKFLLTSTGSVQDDLLAEVLSFRWYDAQTVRSDRSVKWLQSY